MSDEYSGYYQRYGYESFWRRHDQTIFDLWGKKTPREIANIVGRSEGRLRERAHKLNLKPVISPAWTEADVQTLRRMTDEGASARQIGEVIGKSRNAVCGFWNRHNIKVPEIGRNGKSKYKRKPTKPRDPTLQKRSLNSRLSVTRLKQLANPIEPVTTATIIPIGQRVKLFDLKPCHCRWVVGEGENLFFCGAQKMEGSSYCHGHHQIVWRAP